jgi:hypothetical protein
MVVDENEFFRQAVFRICGNLEFEKALQECLTYIRSFMPADMFHLTIYDRGLGALRTIAIATPTEAKRVNLIVPLDDESRKFVEEQELRPALIINPIPSLTKAMANVKGLWKEHGFLKNT